METSIRVTARDPGRERVSAARDPGRIRSIWAFFVAAAMQRLPFVLLAPASVVGLKKSLLIFSYLLLAWALVRNLHFRSVRLVLMGVLLNFVAIVANGGLMPVSPEARSLAGMTDLGGAWLGGATPHGTGILLSVDHTRLWAFTDIIPWNLVGGVFSVGDVALGVGLILLCIEVIRGRTSRAVKMQPTTIRNGG